MYRVTLTKQQSGFTLVELLIVAIILAILAAIIIPQFASTTTDAQESALRANLAGMRSSINLYRQQHNGDNPGFKTAAGGTCSGTAGAGLAGTQQAIEDQLTRYSNLAGQTCSKPDAGFVFGPYIQEDVLPDNPITGTNAFVIVADGNLEMPASGAGLGWKYDTIAGKIIANDSDFDSGGAAGGVTYATY